MVWPDTAPDLSCADCGYNLSLGGGYVDESDGVRRCGGCDGQYMTVADAEKELRRADKVQAFCAHRVERLKARHGQ